MEEWKAKSLGFFVIFLLVLAAKISIKSAALTALTGMDDCTLFTESYSFHLYAHA
jgi:hypothetical protein